MHELSIWKISIFWLKMANNFYKCSELGCVNVQKVFKIMERPPQPIVLVPKVSPSEKLKKNFDARGWTERAEVYIYSLCSEHPPNEVCASKTVLAMHDMTQNHGQTPSAHCFGPKGFTKWNFKKKNLMLEGEPSAPKFIFIAYVVNIPPNEVVLQKCLFMGA